MNATQKRIVVVLGAVTALVFMAVVIASLTPSADEPSAAEPTTTTETPTSTTTSTTETTTTTTEATTTTSSTTSTSTTSTSSTTSTTTTSTTIASQLVLRGDGLGGVRFGDEADVAMQALTTILGPPDEDSGWIASFSGFGTCPGERVRGIRWATLWVLMTDGSTDWRNDGVPHFFTYLNSVFYDDSQSLGLATEEGLALGSTVDELRNTYGGDAVIAFDELTDGFIYSITVPAPGRLGGGLTGDQADDLVTSIDGGTGCGE